MDGTRRCHSLLTVRAWIRRSEPQMAIYHWGVLLSSPVPSGEQVEPAISTLPLLMVQLLTPPHSISVPGLVDSGSSGNFISQALLKQLDLSRKRQAELKIKTIQGKPFGHGHMKFRSLPITLHVGCLHQERISSLVLVGPTIDIIQGHPWLSQHSPKADGIPARSSDGVRPASKTVSPTSLCIPG